MDLLWNLLDAIAHIAATAVCACGAACEPADFGPDPYAHDIHGDDTDVWECDYCRYQSARDI